jgi:cytochrome c-type biogenesis protein CcmE
MSRRTRLWAAVVLVAAALAVLVGYGSKNLTEYYLTLPQFEAKAASLVGAHVRVAGQLVGSSVRFDAKRGVLSFVLRGKGGADLRVEYDGPQPDDFQSNVTAIVDGVYQGGDVLRAQHVLVQCPSHYGPAASGNQG